MNNPEKSTSKTKESTPIKVRCIIACSRHKNKYYEMLAKYKDGTAFIGAKRILQNEVSSNKPVNNSAKFLTGKIEFINGVTSECLHCPSEDIFICNCGCISCDVLNKNHVCPRCSLFTKFNRKSYTDEINLTAGAGNKALGHAPKNAKLLGNPSSGVGGLLGRK